MHKQVCIRVNAWVDSGIAGIVSALNDFPQLETIESCEEGSAERGPWVCFRYGRSWQELAEFALGFLGTRLIGIVGDDVSLQITLMPSGRILGELSLRSGAATRVETALRDLREEFNKKS